MEKHSDAPEALQHQLVGVDELVVVVGASHPWAQKPGRRVSAATLASTPMVAREAGSGTPAREAGAGTRTVLERALAGLPTAPVALELSSTAAVRSAVAAGAGPAAVSMHAVRDDIASGRLVAITVIGLDLHRRFHAVWQGDPTPPAGPRARPCPPGRRRRHLTLGRRGVPVSGTAPAVLV